MQRDSPVIVRNPDVPLPSKFPGEVGAAGEARAGGPGRGCRETPVPPGVASGKPSLPPPLPAPVPITVPPAAPTAVAQPMPTLGLASSPFQPVAFHPSPAALLPVLVPSSYPSHPAPKKEVIMGRPGTGKRVGGWAAIGPVCPRRAVRRLIFSGGFCRAHIPGKGLCRCGVALSQGACWGKSARLC